MPRRKCDRCAVECSEIGQREPDDMFFCPACSEHMRNYGIPEFDLVDEGPEVRKCVPWVVSNFKARCMDVCGKCSKKVWLVTLKDESVICSRCDKPTYKEVVEKLSIYKSWRLRHGPVGPYNLELAKQHGINLPADCSDVEATGIIGKWLTDHVDELPASIRQKALMNCLGIKYSPNILHGEASRLITLAKGDREPLRAERERFYDEVERLEALESARSECEDRHDLSIPTNQSDMTAIKVRQSTQEDSKLRVFISKEGQTWFHRLLRNLLGK
ncbi:MAG: hypothetical protein L6R28_05435 [Planctomycetes bacterium]|nr:hypothetical protein [Planctomycetota bacterium]